MLRVIRAQVLLYISGVRISLSIQKLLRSPILGRFTHRSLATRNGVIIAPSYHEKKTLPHL